MAYNDRTDVNADQKIQNEIKVKSLKRGLTLLPSNESDFPPFRWPFMFIPVNVTVPPYNELPSNIPQAFNTLLSVLDKLPLVLEVPPESIDYTYRKKIQTVQTLAGWVEYHWGDELDIISARGSTGGFINLEAGMSEGIDRRVTFSYILYERLLSLYKNNGAIYSDANGRVSAFSGLRLINDFGIFTGYFNSFNVTESAERPYRFQIDWSFTVEKTLHLFITF